MPPVSTRRSRGADHLILISVDALRPEFYRDERWPAPTLQQLAGESISADAVRSVFPALTYPAHTTLVTGALPARHGIWQNRPFQPEGPNLDWHWYASALQVPTLWDAVREAGGTTAAVAWPVTVGAAIDWNIPDVWIPGNDADSLEPVRRLTTPPGLFEEIEREATGILSPEEFQLGSLGRDDLTGHMAAYLFERYRPTLLLVHLIGADHVQHLHGRGDPRLRRAIATADRAIGTVLEAVERAGLLDTTAVLVAGDHGTIQAHTKLRPNAWLREAGLRQGALHGARWRATFHASGGAAFLRLRDRRDRDAVVQVRRCLDRLSPDVRRLFRVVEREELDALGADPVAPLALAAAPGAIFGEGAAGPWVSPIAVGAHGYLPAYPEMQTGFVGTWTGLRPGRIRQMELEQIAPLAGALLGLNFRGPDGQLPADLR